MEGKRRKPLASNVYFFNRSQQLTTPDYRTEAEVPKVLRRG
jgi:hypothetical protein